MRRVVPLVRKLAYLPNLLSSLRIALAPAMLGAAYSNGKAGFTVLLSAALLTDIVDGPLARRWRVESALGRRLDRWGDGLTMTMGATGVFFLWPHPMEREWPWALLALTGYGMMGLQRLILPATAKSRPRWPAKVASLAMPISLVPLILEIAVWPFQAAAVLQVVRGAWKLLGMFERGEGSKDKAAKAAGG